MARALLRRVAAAMKRREAIDEARPNASAAATGRPRMAWALLVIAIGLYGCVALDPTVAAPPMEAPAWERIAFGTADADLVGAIDLKAVRADPLFGPIVTQLARKDHLGVLTCASQIDVVATVERGKAATWIAVVHGVEGPPRDDDVGSGAGDIVTVPGAWVLGEGPAFQRVRSTPSLASARVVLPGRALFASTVQGRAIPRPPHPELADMTEGLEEATVAVLGGAHLELVLRCRYIDATAARHAATAARLALVAAAARTDAAAALARELVKLDFDASGDVVAVRVTMSDDLRELLQRYIERVAE
jgi:hypothetical protein